MDGKFFQAGHDGDVTSSINLWKKGIVFTSRATQHEVDAGYRISVAFKQGVSPERPMAGFEQLYRRVSSMGNNRVRELIAGRPDLAGTASILCHGWLLLAPGGRPASLEVGAKVASAFVTLALRRAGREDVCDCECAPTDLDLQAPGGTTIEDLARIAPQRAAEVYNEFDFSNSADDPVTVSFGETVARGEQQALDFGPFVARAEAFARSYHGMLVSWGEVRNPFRILRREWFLAGPEFVTVHVCVSRSSS